MANEYATDPRRRINLEGYLRQKVTIRNTEGGRGYERGVRTFDCPLCRDRKGRGWLNVQYWTVGCFNTGCDAEPTLHEGAVEWVRRLEKLPSRADTWIMLRNRYGTKAAIVFAPEPRRGADFCRFPKGMRPFESDRTPLQRSYEKFMERQWNISPDVARSWGLGWCMTGDYAGRVVIPIWMDGQPVAFQARSIWNAEPKYKTSEHGSQSNPDAECARGAAELLFNIDRLEHGGVALLVEGTGDVMGWHQLDHTKSPTAIGLLGVALTPAKLALLSAKAPRLVIVALDAEEDAQRRAQQHLSDLQAWDLTAVLGEWVGGKDSGSGATLVTRQAEMDVSSAVRRRLAAGSRAPGAPPPTR